MIIRIEDLKNICSTILGTIDSNELSTLTETLELKAEKGFLCLSVTNREYYVKVKIKLNEDINFHATVNAKIFLKLIAQTTSETVNLNVIGNFLEVVGNGRYQLPMIFDNDSILILPEIIIYNPTTSFDISTDILNSILKFNSKEFSKGIIANPIQSMYYIDEKGCITFTSGACVNNFTLQSPIKLLLNNRLVKLFKLFKSGNVKFTLGYDALSDEIIQTKVKFENDYIEITSLLSSDNSLVNSVPVDAIRQRAEDLYSYSILIEKEALLQTINRLLLFTSGYGAKEILKPYSKFEFLKDFVVIYDATNVNKEKIYYQKSIEGMTDNYEAIIDLTELKNTLDGCSDQYINMRFGNHQAFVIARNNIVNIIPECINLE